VVHQELSGKEINLTARDQCTASP